MWLHGKPIPGWLTPADLGINTVRTWAHSSDPLFPFQARRAAGGAGRGKGAGRKDRMSVYVYRGGTCLPYVHVQTGTRMARCLAASLQAEAHLPAREWAGEAGACACARVCPTRWHTRTRERTRERAHDSRHSSDLHAAGRARAVL